MSLRGGLPGAPNLFGSSFLSDFTVHLPPHPPLPVHGIILAQSSPVLRAVVELKAAEGAPGSPTSAAQRTLTLPVAPGEQQAALLTLRAM